MGRYYNGDIDGKFWFGVQSSNDADFFGVIGEKPEELEYCFGEDNLDEVLKGISKCRRKLGLNKVKLDKFFKANESYNEDMLVKDGFKKVEIIGLLEWYARLDLGIKIRNCIKKDGECIFTAEM